MNGVLDHVTVVKEDDFSEPLIHKIDSIIEKSF